MNKENAKQMIGEIKANLSQKSCSQKDEIRVMKAMLNDPDYKVDVYDKSGLAGQYCPYEDARALFAGVVASVTNIPKAEAVALSANYEVTKTDAESLIGVSKEFINTYLQTGRKMALGVRETTNATLIMDHVKEKENRSFPNSNSGVVLDVTITPAHDKIKCSSKCPAHLKNK